jgi:uncharacterized tellurite resistance protein B-like protein/predicted RNA-binding Zn-ribbon protein involved in translation (DUF1610 family)
MPRKFPGTIDWKKHNYHRLEKRMLAFIIFGTRGVTSTKEKGEFHCPQCNGANNYRHKSVRRFFTLYFIPIIPLDHLGEYVECERCQGTYDVGILEYDPQAAGLQVEALFMVAMKQVMIAMLLADGVIDDSEVAELQATYEDLSGLAITEQDLREEIEVIQQKGSDAIELVSHLGPGLNDKGKEMVITAAYQIAAADGIVDESESQLLEQVADSMELTKAHFRGILAGLESPTIAK